LSPASKFRFGPFELSTRARELYKNGRKVKLRPQAFQILLLLLENAGEVVTRDQVRERVWTSDTFVDFEHGLNTAIKELRGVLNDSAKEPRYIETLPKLGYRLIAPVEQEPAQAGAEVQAPEAAGPAAGEAASAREVAAENAPRARMRTGWAMAAIGIAAIAVLVLSVKWLRNREAPRAESAMAAKPSGGRLMLAVLPFDNLTGDAAQEYFSDGMTEEMIAQLGRLDQARMGVIARTSVMGYKHAADALEKVTRELGVQYVLEGSVRRDGGRVRVTTELIQTKDQTRVWGKEYDRDLSNLLELQAEIAGEIATEVDLRLAAPGTGGAGSPAGTEASLSPARLEAYDLYLQGRFFLNKRTVEGFERAVDYFQQAIAKDAGYARAYAGLADAYALIGAYLVVPPNEIMPKARAAAQKAAELNPSLPEAHAALAVIAQDYDWDWRTAEKEYRRAIELDANYATAHHWYAEELALVGRFPEALAEIERARQLDPLSLIIEADLGAILFYSRQYDRAIEKFRAVLDVEPCFPRAEMVILPYVQERKYAEAEATLGRCEAAASREWAPELWLLRAYVFGRAGETVRARREFQRALAAGKRHRITNNSLATTQTGIGDKAKALEYLEKAYADRTISPSLKVSAVFDPLRGEPRFQKLLQGMGLAQ